MEEQYQENDFREDTGDFDNAVEEDYPVKSKNRSMLLIICQLVVCIVCIAGAITIKLIGGSVYAAVGTWFFDQYNNTIFTGNGEGILPFRDEVSVKENGMINEQTGNGKEKNTASGQIKETLTKPLSKIEITSGFGKRELDGQENEHKGVDLAAKENDAIFAAIDGEVTIAQEDSSYGNYIVITHKNNIKTLYAHCSKLIAKKGDKVRAGDKIALAGSTGQAYGTHLHFEILINGKNVDPAPYLVEKEKAADEA